MSDVAALETFIAASAAAASEDALFALVDDLARDMGFERFAICQLDFARQDDVRAPIAIVNYPWDWIEEIERDRLIGDDPVWAAGRRTRTGFRWDDVGRVVRVTDGHRRVFDRGRAHGLGTGFSIGGHAVGEPLGVVSFVMRPGCALRGERLVMAEIAGGFAYQAARRLRDARLEQPFAAAVRLTPRQTEVLLLAARGKSDWEIARILGLSEATVADHLNDARRRYGVSRRLQLIVHAIHDGHFSLAEALAVDRRRDAPHSLIHPARD